MKDKIKITFHPSGKTVFIRPGMPLMNVLFRYGAEFPCGGRGICRGCKIKVIKGRLHVTPDQAKVLSATEILAGWRLACRCAATEDIVIELAQWENVFLADETAFDFTPEEGYGIAVDIGTTTIALQLLDLRTAEVLAVQTALNMQARYGADIMSRVNFAIAERGQAVLQNIIRRQTGDLVRKAIKAAGIDDGKLRRIVIAGNTVMHNLFCGIDVKPMASYPFEPEDTEMKVFGAKDIGWKMDSNAPVIFLPCIGGFVGSDVLTGIMTVKVHEHAGPKLIGFADIGTNGEIVLGNSNRILCASTAAGPAFEGAGIKMGMRAREGAISAVTVENKEFKCTVLGDTRPRGICGSGLIDAVAAGLKSGMIDRTGRLVNSEKEMKLAPPVVITQKDIRQLQLAKAAIAAGIRILLREVGAEPGDVERFYLAGAFGNYINRESARRTGMLDFHTERISPAGNTALAGLKISLFDATGRENGYNAIRQKTKHVSLHMSSDFQDIFAHEMHFPAR